MDEAGLRLTLRIRVEDVNRNANEINDLHTPPRASAGFRNASYCTGKRGDRMNPQKKIPLQATR
jgi:hypothetical protein